MQRVSGNAGKIIVAKLVDVLYAGFCGNSLHHVTGKHLRTENSRDPFRTYLLDQGNHLARRRLGKIRRLSRSNHGEVVSIGEVSPRVVVRQQFTVFYRDSDHHGFYGLVQLPDALLEGGVVGCIVIGVGRVPGRQIPADDFCVAKG